MILITVVLVGDSQTLEATLASLIAQTQISNELVLLWDEQNPDRVAWENQKAAVYAKYFLRMRDVSAKAKSSLNETIQNVLTPWTTETNARVHIVRSGDTIYPNFYERHKALHQQADFPFTASPSWCINESERLVKEQSWPTEILDAQDPYFSVDFGYLSTTIATLNRNWLGGISNIVWKTSALRWLTATRIGAMALGEPDLLSALLLAAVEKPCGLISTPLGVSRQSTHPLAWQTHPWLSGYDVFNMTTIIVGAWSECYINTERLNDYLRLSLNAWRANHIGDENLLEFMQSVTSHAHQGDLIENYNRIGKKILYAWGVNLQTISKQKGSITKANQTKRIQVVVDIPLNTITYFNIRNNNKGLTEAWLAYRLDIFFRFSLGSLMAQTDKDFYCIVHYLKESKDIIHRLLKKYPALPSHVMFRCDGDSVVGNLARNCEYIYKLRLDSDNIIHPHFVEQLKLTQHAEGLKCIIGRRGYVYDLSSGRLALWDHNSSAFNTYVFPAATYDENSCLPSWEPEYHMSAINLEHEFLFADSENGRSYVILVHGDNLQNEFDDITSSEYFSGLVTDPGVKALILNEFCMPS